jgi:SPOR domain
MSYQFEPAQFEGREELLGDRRDAAEPPRQRLLTVVAALVVMGLFAAGLWFAYYEGARRGGGGEVPLIRADARPMMVRPAEPGGLRIPDRNMLIFDPDKQMVEHLLPPPEQPMPRPTAASRPVAAAAQEQPNPALPVVTAGASATRASDRRDEAPSRSVAAAEPPAREAGARPAQGGSVRLQLGAVRSADAARLEWERMRHRNSDLLGKLSATAVRADLGDKGVYYRIWTGPVGDLAAAGRICRELRERKVGCIIVR